MTGIADLTPMEPDILVVDEAGLNALRRSSRGDIREAAGREARRIATSRMLGRISRDPLPYWKKKWTSQ